MKENKNEDLCIKYEKRQFLYDYALSYKESKGTEEPIHLQIE